MNERDGGGVGGRRGERAARGGSARSGSDNGGSARRPLGLSSSRDRFAARATHARRRPWLFAAWAVGVLAVVAGSVWVVELSPLLTARSVMVEGVPPGSVDEIIQRAAVPLGTPLARVDTDSIAHRVIASAALAEVTVGRSWPNTIVITASPRVPVLAVKNPQGQVQVVDVMGVAYATVSVPPPGVPLIHSMESPPTKDSLMAGITVMRALSASQRSRVSNVTVSGPNMVTLKLGGVLVVWGGAADPALKVTVMTALLKHQGFSTIDVSAPRTPVTR